MRTTLLVFALLFFAATANAQTGHPASCKVLYSMIEEDTLRNVNQGLIASGIKEKDGLKWLEKMYKKYPDVCYTAPNTGESVDFVIIETPAVYHGTRVETDSHAVTNSSGQAETDSDGNTVQTTNSVAVPYEAKYGVFTLTVVRKSNDGHFQPVRRFKVDGLYHMAYGISWGKGKHPVVNVMEDAIKWIHDGGLNNPMQTVAAN